MSQRSGTYGTYGRDSYIVLLVALKSRHNMVVGVDRQIVGIEVDGVDQQRDGFLLNRFP
jgi:hypothetical protein